MLIRLPSLPAEVWFPSRALLGVTGLATQRLVDAAAELEPADRALLSLLINHGLDDETLGRMMQVSAAAIASRRDHLVERLGLSLGLPPSSVREALQELAASARGPVRAAGDSSADGIFVDTEVSPANGRPSPPGTDRSAVTPERPAAERPPSERPPPERPASLHRPRRRPAGVLAVGLLLAVVLVIALSAGKSSHRAEVSTSSQTASAQTATTQATVTGVAPAPVARAPHHRRPLAGLPGGPAGVTGSAAVVGPAGRPRLALSASGLPPLRHGHYELWLYNSIIDAVPLGRVRAPRDSLAVALPARYHHYQWVDISLQPPGLVNHSGESILRAPLIG